MSTNNSITKSLFLSLLFASSTALGQDCVKKSDGSEEYGHGPNVSFIQSVEGEVCRSEKDKEYEKKVDADWPKMSNYFYFNGGVGYPEHKLSYLKDSVQTNSESYELNAPVTFSQGEVINKKEYILNLHGKVGYKWDNWAIELVANYVSKKDLNLQMTYQVVDGDDTIDKSFFINGDIKNFGLLLNTKYHFVNYKRFSPYVGIGAGIKQNFGKVSIYKGTHNDTGASDYIPQDSDFSKADIRELYLDRLNNTYDFTSENAFDSIFEGIQGFVDSIIWNLEVGVQYYLMDDLILDISVASMNYGDAAIKTKDKEKTDKELDRLITLSGPRTVGFHVGLTYAF